MVGLNDQNAVPVYIVDGNLASKTAGQASGPQTYQLASNQSLTAQAGTSANPTAGSTTTPVTGVAGGSYLWDAQFTGTSVTLQSLGSDGVTWRDVATRTTPGTTGVVIGQNASVRLYNPNNSAVTGLYSNLS